MSNPRMLQAAMAAGTGGSNAAELLRIMGEETSRDPRLLSAAMTSPLLASLLSARTQAARSCCCRPAQTHSLPCWA